MSQFQRLWARISICAALLALVLSAGTGTAAAAVCDTYIHTAGGSWATGANWSTGSPPTATVAGCITAAMTGPVTLSGAGSAKSLTVGATTGSSELILNGANLTLASPSMIEPTGSMLLEGNSALNLGTTGRLTNDGTLTTNGALLSGAVTNANDGFLAVDAGTNLGLEAGTLTNDGQLSVAPNATLSAPANGGKSATIVNTAGAIENQGRVAVSAGGTFTQGAGQVIGKSIYLAYPSGGALVLSGGGSGTFLLQSGATVTGNVSADQTIIVDGATATASFTNAGTLMGGGGGVTLTLPAGGTLTNTGLIVVPSPSDNLTVAGNVDNQTSGTIALNGSLFTLSGAVTLTNDGTITIPPNSTLQTGSGGTIDNVGGTITNGGTINVAPGGAFDEGNGRITGNPAAVSGALSFTGNGSSGFSLNGSDTLSGTIAAGQLVRFIGSVTAAASFTNDGVIIGAGGAGISLPTGGTLTNNGTVEFGPGGLVVNGNLTNTASGVLGENAGTLTIGRAGTTFDNAGTMYLLYPAFVSLSAQGNCGGSGQPPCNITWNNTGTIYWGMSDEGVGWGGAGNASSFQGNTGDTVSLGGTIIPVPEGEPTPAPPPSGQTLQYGIGSPTVPPGAKNPTWTMSCPATVKDGWSVGCPDYTTLTQSATATLIPTDVNVTGTGTEGQYGWTTTYGQPITITATVSAQDGSTPTGTVSFYAPQQNTANPDPLRPDLLGTAALSTTAGVTTASLTTSLPPGVYNLMALYTGDSTHLAGSTQYNDNTTSHPAGGSETVNIQNTTVAVRSSGTTPFGAPATLTATVTPASGGPLNPTGIVTFDSAGVPIGVSAVSTRHGTTTAVLTTTSLLVGNDSITATYSGDITYAASTTSSAFTQTISAPMAPAHVTVSGPSSVSHGATYRATVTTDGTGSVLFALSSSPKAPAGLAVNPTTGAVTFKVPASGLLKFSYAVVADNAGGEARSKTVTVKIT